MRDRSGELVRTVVVLAAVAVFATVTTVYPTNHALVLFLGELLVVIGLVWIVGSARGRMPVFLERATHGDRRIAGLFIGLFVVAAAMVLAIIGR